MPTLRLGAGLAPMQKKTFSPLKIPALTLWLDPSDAQSLTLDGSNITQINDKSGNTHHASSTGTARPVLTNIDGKNWMGFDGVNDVLSITDHSNFDHASSGFTAIVVAKQNTAAATAFGPFISKYSSLTGQREWLLGTVDATNGYAIGWTTNGTTYVSLDIDIPNTTDKRIAAIRYGGESDQKPEILLDGTIPRGKSAANVAIHQGTQPIRIGNNGASTWLDGQIGEVLYFNQYISDRDMDKIGKYLQRKWGTLDYAQRDETLITTHAGQSNATNAFFVGTAYGQSYNRDGANAYEEICANYFTRAELLRNAANGKPVMQASSSGNQWVNSNLTDGPLLIQWKSQLSGYVKQYGTYGNSSRTMATIWLGSEGDTGQDENDFYDALDYMFHTMRDYTNADHKIFVTIPGTFTAGGFDNHQRQRNAILRIINDLDFVCFGAEAFDIPLADSQHYTPEGQVILHARLANRIAAVMGKRSESGTLGPIITSASYSGNIVTAHVTLDGAAGISGSETEQFYIEDDGTAATISSLSIAGSVMTLTLSSPIASGSDVKLWCNYGRGASITQANLIKDSNGMVMRSIANMPVSEA